MMKFYLQLTDKKLTATVFLLLPREAADAMGHFAKLIRWLETCALVEKTGNL